MEAMKSSCFCRQLFGFFGGSAWKKARAGEIIYSANRHGMILYHLSRVLETLGVCVRVKTAGEAIGKS